MTFKLQIAHITRYRWYDQCFPLKTNSSSKNDLHKYKETFLDTEERGHRSCKSYEIIQIIPSGVKSAVTPKGLMRLAESHTMVCETHKHAVVG